MPCVINHCRSCNNITTLDRVVVGYECPRCRHRRAYDAILADGLMVGQRRVERPGFTWTPTPMGDDDGHDHRNPRVLRDYGRNDRSTMLPVVKQRD